MLCQHSTEKTQSEPASTSGAADVTLGCFENHAQETGPAGKFVQPKCKKPGGKLENKKYTLVSTLIFDKSLKS